MASLGDVLGYSVAIRLSSCVTVASAFFEINIALLHRRNAVALGTVFSTMREGVIEHQGKELKTNEAKLEMQRAMIEKLSTVNNNLVIAI